MESPTYLRFCVSGDFFALPHRSVAEVLHLPRLATPPGLPAVVAGFLDLGGEIVSVLRLDRLLDIGASTPGLYSHLLRLHAPDPDIALLVDRAIAVDRILPDRVGPVGDDETFRGCVVGEITGEEGAVHVLSVERLLSEHERQRIEAFREAERHRRIAFGNEE